MDLCKQEIIKLESKLMKLNEGIIYNRNFKTSPFRKLIGTMFNLRQKYEDEGKIVYGEDIRKNISEEYKSVSDYWMSTKCDGGVSDY